MLFWYRFSTCWSWRGWRWYFCLEIFVYFISHVGIEDVWSRCSHYPLPDVLKWFILFWLWPARRCGSILGFGWLFWVWPFVPAVLYFKISVCKNAHRIYKLYKCYNCLILLWFSKPLFIFVYYWQSWAIFNYLNTKHL